MEVMSLSLQLYTSVGHLSQMLLLSEGFYHCQVQMIDRSVQSQPSQKFEVFNRDRYLQAGTSCSERTFTAPLQSCAVYRIREDTPTTTAVINATTATVNDRHNTIGGTTLVLSESQSTPPLPTGSDNNEGDRALPIWVYILIALVAVVAVIIVLAIVVTFVLNSLRHSKATNDEGKYTYITYTTQYCSNCELGIG